MRSAIEDVSALTTIPVTGLNKLVEKTNWCICDCIEETQLSGEKLTEIDIGIGVLSVYADEAGIQYRFVPSKKLENAVRTTITTKKSPLVQQVEATLVQRILETYKSYI